MDLFIGLVNWVLLMECLISVVEWFVWLGVLVSLLLVDFDGFKIVNDSMGYAVGDLFLCMVVARLVVVIWFIDVVVCFGGDEFAVLCYGVDELELVVIAERVLEVLNEFIFFGGN